MSIAEKELTQETKTLIVFTRHIKLVQKYLGKLAHRLEERATEHDISKFAEDEFGGFVEINRIAREYPYGSPEYKASITGNNAVDLHWSRNSHHPEFHPGGVSDMSLLDIIEMVVDWKAASEAYGQTSLEDSIEEQRKRFKLTDEQMYLVRLIAKELDR